MESVNVLYVLSFVLLLGSATVKSLEFCREQQVIQLTEFGQEIFINSPQYPDLYVTSRNCTVSINVVLHTPHVIHIEHLVTNCFIPYYIVGVNFQYPTCTRMTTEYLQSTDVPHNKDTTNEFKLLLQPGAGDGFNFSVKAYPLVSMEPTDSTVDVTTTPTTYITSHQGFTESFYSNNLHNKLTLSDIPSGYVVLIEFVYFRLGSNYNCKTGSSAGDVFIVSKVEEDSVIYECGDIINNLIPPPLIVINTTDPTSSLLLEFITDNIQIFQGFLLRCATSAPAPKGTTISQITTEPAVTSTEITKASVKEATEKLPKETTYTARKETEENEEVSTSNQPDVVKMSLAVAGGVVVGVIIGVVVTLAVVHRRFSSRENRDNEHIATELAERGPDYDTVVGADNSAVVDEAETAVTYDEGAAHRYSDVDLPERDNSASANEYMSLNTTSVLSSTEDKKKEDTHLYEKLQKVNK